MKSEPAILDKIRKLPRLAGRSRGSTENEAKVALAKAQQLMTRHNIDSALLRMERGEGGCTSFTVNKAKNEVDAFKQGTLFAVVQGTINARKCWTKC